MRATLLSVLILLALRPSVVAQNPLRHWTDAIEARYADSQPVLAYTLRVDSTDLSGLSVTIDIRNAPDTVRLALAAHPEYDDRFYRFVERVSATSSSGSAAAVVREDSARWRVAARGGTVTVRYRLRVPEEASPRAAWRPFLTPSGGLVGGAHAFMYVVGASLAPAHVTLDLPVGWDIATGLEPTSDRATFYAPSAYVLTESPMLVGHLRSWTFRVHGVPHRVVYWPAPDATPFDTVSLVDGLERLVRQAADLFGRLPYREYTFLLQDRAYGALEHANSVTLGAPSRGIAADRRDVLAEAAHEYVHAWNLMRIHPAEYGDVSYRTPPRSRGLWWGEGVTMYVADLLLRRAGLPTHDSTRAAHLESLIARYLARSGNARFSPESVSAVTYGAPPDALGDYDASVHLQGELIATLLDLRIRAATDGRRTLTDVLRLMLERFSAERGYTGADIRQAIADVCDCEMRRFFEEYVHSAHRLDFDRYLAVAGFRIHTAWEPARDRDGGPVADLRVYAWRPPGSRRPSLLIVDPASAWGRAGLHSGDVIVAVNGVAVPDWPAFRELKNGLHIGDTVVVDVLRRDQPVRATVHVTGFNRPVVHLEPLPAATERQRRLGARWLQGDSGKASRHGDGAG